ncbi:MAG: YegP family protein, partial [Bacteroidales bacterium]|nr:YegP family protein [Bacteroidales bacterium]
MRSETLYPTKQASEEGWNEFLAQAGAFSNYKLSEKQPAVKQGRSFEIFVGKDQAYYFCLKAANGDVILNSEGYKNKQGSENGIEALKANASNDAGYERLVTPDNQHYFVVKAKNGKVICTSKCYATKANMEKDAKMVKNNASLIETADSTLKAGHRPYSFTLLGVSKQVLANHTSTYHTEQERDFALQSVINYVSYTEYRENIAGTAGSYTFALKGKKDSVLLESALHYADEPSAIGAFKAMVELARERNNYVFSEEGFGFEIVNEQNEVWPARLQAMCYNRNERDAAIELLLAYLRNDVVKYAIENVGGAFFSEITDHYYNPLLQGTVLSPSKEKAMVELGMLVGMPEAEMVWGYGSDPDYYFQSNNQHEICPHGFSILNEVDEPVAKHPFRYHSQAGLHKAMLNVLSWLSDYTKLKDHFINTHQWQEINNWQNETLLHIDYEYLATNGIEAVMQLAVHNDNYKVVYKDSNYLLILMDTQGSTVAKHPKYLPSEKVANDKMADIILFMQLNAGWFDNPAQNKPFTIFNELGAAMLQSTTGFNNIDTLAIAYDRGADKNSYKLVPEQETVNNVSGEPVEGFSFQLWNGNYHIADHVAFYTDAQQRDDALDNLVASLQTNWLPSRLMDFVDTWYYTFSDFAGRVLLSSKNQTEFLTQIEAEDAYEKAMLLALDINNYQSVLRYQPVDLETKKCYYSFVINNTLEGGSGILFAHGAQYDCIKDRDQAIQDIVDLLKTKQFKTSIKGTTCGYTYKLTYMFVPETEADVVEITIESAIHFPTRGEAMEAANKLADLMKSAQNYVEPEENEEAMWLIIDAYNNILAHIMADGDAEAIKQGLINHVSNTGTTVSFSIDTKETNVQYRLTDENGLLLQTVSDHTDTEKCFSIEASKICEKSDLLASLGQHDKYYRKISSVGQCLHGFELLDNHGNLLAEHGKLYFSSVQSNAVIGKIQDLLNSEGMHLVEHLLLRPTQTVLHPQYHFVVKVAGELLL